VTGLSLPHSHLLPIVSSSEIMAPQRKQYTGTVCLLVTGVSVGMGQKTIG